MARPPSANSIIRNAKKQQVQKKTPVATDMYIPNHSGDLSRGDVKATPGRDYAPVNKLYVDDADNLKLNLDASNDPITGDLTIAETKLFILGDTVPGNDGISMTYDFAKHGVLFVDTVPENGAAFDINSPNALRFYSNTGMDADGNFEPSIILNVTGTCLFRNTTQGTVPNRKCSFDFTSGTHINTGNFTVDTNTLFVDAANDRVGIGTGSPLNKLHVLQSAVGEYTARFRHDGAASGGRPTGVIIETSNESNVASDPLLNVRILNGNVNKFWVQADGKVGIGTRTPSALLDVVGDATILDGLTGNTSLGSTGNFVWKPDNGGGGMVYDVDADGGSGGLGLGTATPSATLDLAGGDIDDVADIGLETINEECKITALGGYAISLTNKTGVNSVAGKLVKADTATDDAVVLTGATDDECFGVFLDSGIADGAEAWIVIGGIADVLFDDNVTAVRGNWVGTGQAGLARTQAAPPALGIAAHFEEIGHSIENVTATGGGTFILARCILHFN